MASSFIEDNVHIKLDKIAADGDRYLDLDPTQFDCNNIDVNSIEVIITEGVKGAYGGLFELRGNLIWWTAARARVIPITSFSVR
jgi:hypothetical protein